MYTKTSQGDSLQWQFSNHYNIGFEKMISLGRNGMSVGVQLDSFLKSFSNQ